MGAVCWYYCRPNDHQPAGPPQQQRIISHHPVIPPGVSCSRVRSCGPWGRREHPQGRRGAFFSASSSCVHPRSAAAAAPPPRRRRRHRYRHRHRPRHQQVLFRPTLSCPPALLPTGRPPPASFLPSPKSPPPIQLRNDLPQALLSSTPMAPNLPPKMPFPATAAAAAAAPRTESPLPSAPVRSASCSPSPPAFVHRPPRRLPRPPVAALAAMVPRRQPRCAPTASSLPRTHHALHGHRS